MVDASTYNAPLSRREVQLLSEWERARRSLITIQDIRDRVGAQSARNVTSGLVRKGGLQRVRPGVYLVRPFRTIGRPSAPSTAVALEALLHDQPHYLGGLWALSFHRLTEQRYDSILDAFVTRRLAARRIGAARVRFHVLEPTAFEYGIVDSMIEGVAVRVSDPERTVLDALDRPRVFFGVDRALELAKFALPKMNRERVVSYAVAGSKPSTCQRLGVLLERTGGSRKELARLLPRATETKSLLSLYPDRRRSGTVNRKWNVVENDP